VAQRLLHAMIESKSELGDIHTNNLENVAV
jgi:hypothetical protein